MLPEEICFQKKYATRRNMLPEEICYQKKYASRRNMLPEEICFQKKYVSRRKEKTDEDMCRIPWVECHEAFEVFLGIFMSSLSCRKAIANSGPAEQVRRPLGGSFSASRYELILLHSSSGTYTEGTCLRKGSESKTTWPLCGGGMCPQ